MANKDNKKGFWATLFASKKKNCCCGSDMIVEDNANKAQSCGCSCEPTAQEEASQSAEGPSAGTNVSEVLVLGPGCSKCKKTYQVVEGVIADNNLDVRLSKIEDIGEMMKYNIMTTPAVVVDGAVRIKGHVPSADEVKKTLGL